MPKTVNNVPGVGTVHFPDAMTEEQIAEAIQRFPQNQKFNDQITDKLWMQSPGFREEPSSVVAAGRGAQDVLDRVAQLTVAGGEAIGHYPEGLGDELTKILNQEQADYEASRGTKQGSFDTSRMAGSIGMQSPLALMSGGATVPAQIVRGAASGAASGLATYDPTNSLRQGATNIVVGAGTGAVAAPIASLAVKGADALGSRILGRFKGVMERTKGAADPVQILKEVPEMRQLPVDQRAGLILEAQEQIKKTGTLNIEQLGRKANLQANDVVPTKSMVTRDSRDWTMERNMQKLAQSPDEQIAGMGQELTDTYNANDKALSAKLRSLSPMQRGSQEAHGMGLMDTLADIEKKSQGDVSKIYDERRALFGDNLASDAKGVYRVLTDPDNVDNAYTGNVLKSVQGRLKRYGMLDDSGELTDKTLTVKQADEFRKYLQTLKGDPREDRVVNQFIKAVDEDVLNGAGEDFMAVARGAARDRFAKLNNPATQRALNAYGELQQGKTAQNFIKTSVIDAADQDVKTLLDTFGMLSKTQGEEAKQQMQAGVIDYLQTKAVNPNSGQFSGANLNRALEKFGDAKLNLVFGKEGADQLKSLARAGIDATYQPPYSAVNSSNTAPMILAMTQRARAVPGVPLVINENLEKAAARSGYKGQLKTILSGDSKNPLPQFNSRLGLIRSSAVPAVNSALDQRRKRPNSDSK